MAPGPPSLWPRTWPPPLSRARTAHLPEPSPSPRSNSTQSRHYRHGPESGQTRVGLESDTELPPYKRGTQGGPFRRFLYAEAAPQRRPVELDVAGRLRPWPALCVTRAPHSNPGVSSP
ncbi:hypothetical protein U9M48_027707 [Paspalum notatum var. saurae]|uniref:Uncharacterized protein n=1 Tax=Paspalum notatum var. saurae TaxID=547442 RepID=A0AAQ3TWY4_PASNO